MALLWLSHRVGDATVMCSMVEFEAIAELAIALASIAYVFGK